MTATVSTGPAIRLIGVGKTYAHSPTPALRDVDLEVDRGSIVAVVGESGSGKTTLGRLLVGLSAPTSGRIEVAGQPPELVNRRRRGHRRPAQMVFQDVYGSLNPSHTIGYQLSDAYRASHPRRLSTGDGPVTRDGRAAELLDRVGLRPADRYLRRRPDELSGGQRQRVGIARALAADPEVIVADEPTSMLDVSIRREILDLLAGLCAGGVTVVYITHDLLSAGYLADRVVVLYRGAVVEDGPALSVLTHPRHSYTRLLAAASPGLELARAADARPRPEGRPA